MADEGMDGYIPIELRSIPYDIYTLKLTHEKRRGTTVSVMVDLPVIASLMSIKEQLTYSEVERLLDKIRQYMYTKAIPDEELLPGTREVPPGLTEEVQG